MSLPTVSDLALKEWAVAVKSLGRGEQVIILRKGGIHREDRDFRLVHPQFLLYPTYEHQKVELIKPEVHTALEETRLESNGTGLVNFRYFCDVTDKFELRDVARSTRSRHRISGQRSTPAKGFTGVRVSL